MILNASWRENLVRRLRQMCSTAASGGSMAILSFRRNLDMDAVLLAIAGDFYLLGGVWRNLGGWFFGVEISIHLVARRSSPRLTQPLRFRIWAWFLRVYAHCCFEL